MKRLYRKRKKLSNNHFGLTPPPPSRIAIFHYEESALQEVELKSSEELAAFCSAPGVTWINVDGSHDVPLLEKIGGHFGLHPLVVEDIHHPDQRPKVDDYDGYIYIVLKMLTWKEDLREVHGEQVSLVLGPNYVLSFQEEVAGDLFDPIRDRLRKKIGRIRKLGPDYLLYSLLDAVIDHDFVILEKLGEQIEELEEELLERASPATLHAVNHLRREVIFLRRSIWPLREVVQGLEREETPLIQPATVLYLRDLYDHTLRIMDTVETHRDMLAGMLDIYLSSVSNKLNQVMKVLTIIATIFIPLTFLAGVYGMNFKHMPELEWRYGYFWLWGIMIAAAAGMLYAFRRKGWL